jgi:DNA-binding LytR/AlgR family response regulator
MKNKRILIVGKESLFPDEAKKQLHGSGHRLIYLATEPNDLLEEIQICDPDLILIDDSSNEALSVLTRGRETLKIPVFVLSSEAESFQEALHEANVAYGNVLPKNEPWHLGVAVEKALVTRLPGARSSELEVSYRKRSGYTYLFVREHHQLRKVNFKDILYVEAAKDYVYIHTAFHDLSAHISMKELADLLPTDCFVRIHRSYMVNVERVALVKYPSLLVDGRSIALPIGGYFKKDLYERMLIV